MAMKLREAARSRGLRQWLTHDMICRELFNLGFSSGQSGALCAWQVELTNGEDDALVSWCQGEGPTHWFWLRWQFFTIKTPANHQLLVTFSQGVPFHRQVDGWLGPTATIGISKAGKPKPHCQSIQPAVDTWQTWRSWRARCHSPISKLLRSRRFSNSRWAFWIWISTISWRVARHPERSDFCEGCIQWLLYVTLLYFVLLCMVLVMMPLLSFFLQFESPEPAQGWEAGTSSGWGGQPSYCAPTATQIWQFWDRKSREPMGGQRGGLGCKVFVAAAADSIHHLILWFGPCKSERVVYRFNSSIFKPSHFCVNSAASHLFCPVKN